MQRSVPRSDLEPGRPVAHPGTAIAVADREPVPIRIGVLGCSSIARRRMLPAMAADPSVGVVAIASRNPAAAAEVAGGYGCAAVTGYQALLERSDVEAVYAPLPLALHEEWADACLAAGKHLLLEKPMTADPAVTRRLLRRAERAGLVLMENVMFVQHRQHDAIRRLVADGLIGELRSLRAVFTIPALPDQDIRYQPELGGGALWDV
ncbi:MAG TPA: Gfo/Idh/MocA family oxidoreductase, partial [Jatrophihabitans sp.]|nr:Gfo/Idh/MocA family oxidoreductase [Jatrophihabitans sp.]